MEESYDNKYRIGVYGSRNICQKVCSLTKAESNFVADMSTGYSGNLDMDIAYLDTAGWKAYAKAAGHNTKTETSSSTEKAQESAPSGSTLDLAYGVMKDMADFRVAR